MLTPSSNTVLEPVCAAILHDLPDVSVHFSRFRVTQIALSAASDAQFDRAEMLRAARLLADARVDAICWNGTSASWLGVNWDRDLSRAITDATGVPATSAVLAMVEALKLGGHARLGLVTPYVGDVQNRIIDVFAAEGFDIVAERHLGLSDNLAMGAVDSDRLADMLRDVARARPQAIMVMCTNLRAAPITERLERQTGTRILDSVATSVWGSLRLAGVDTARVGGWGGLFRI